MILKENLAREVKSEPKTKAATQARKMGLRYIGFGRYIDKSGKQSYFVKNDQLVPFKKEEDIYKEFQKATEMSASAGNNPELLKKSDQLKKQAESSLGEREKITANMRKKTFSWHKEATKLGKELNDLYSPDLFTKSEIDAIFHYTTEMFLPINQYLYSGNTKSQYPIQDVVKTIADLDSAMDQTETPIALTVYSGLSSRYNSKNMMVGQKYLFRGFVSTTLSIDHAVNFSGGESSDVTEKILLQIEVPAGASGIYIDALSGHTGEKEFLLPRGSWIMVESGPHLVPENLAVSGFHEIPTVLFHCSLVLDNQEE